MSSSGAPLLQDVRAKLDWAWNHFNVLRPEIEAAEKGDDHTITVDVNRETGEYVFHIIGLNEIDHDWDLRIGDCLHNARAALDYLMVRLVARATGEEPRDVEHFQFPIHNDPAKFKETMAKLSKVVGFNGYLTRLQELQPFELGNPSIWGTDHHGGPILALLPGALHRLSHLDNLDKHRIINATWHGVAWHQAHMPKFPQGFQQLSASTYTDTLQNGAKVGEWRFATPLPIDWQPNEVEMKRAFPLYVAFDEAALFNGVLEVLPFCLRGVEAVIALFEPVFVHGRPPLPVTASLALLR